MPAESGRLVDMAEGLGRDPRWAPWPTPHVLARVDSTMTWLRALPEAVDGTTVIADEQTSGRGRLDRRWESPPGSGVWASVLIRPDGVDPASLGVLPLRIGVEIAERLSRLSETPIAVKWPNDVVIEIDDRVRKIAGVLIERLPDGAIIIGVGANAVGSRHPLPDHAVAVDEIPGSASVTREQVAVAVLVAIAEAVRSWEDGDHDLDQYRRHCITLGRRVSISGADASLDREYEALDVDAGGRLLVRGHDGEVALVSAGDVSLGSAQA